MYVTKRRRLELPASLRAKLLAFRQQVWLVKLLESAGATVAAVVAGYLATFCLDRLIETPMEVRLGLFVAAAATAVLIPVAVYRWVWRRRKLDQLAHLLCKKHPSIGDQLLGIVELVENEAEQQRSMALCQAAVTQVAADAQAVDFRHAVPNPRHRHWLAAASAALAVGVALFIAFPAASRNALARYFASWTNTPRYTFAMVQPMPEQVIVPHGEAFPFSVSLADETMSRPAQARAQIGEQPPVIANLAGGGYRFQFPPQIAAGPMTVRVGDFTQKLEVQPTLRPELTSIVADVTLPEYLERTAGEQKDVRSGSVALVNGSTAQFRLIASRDLASLTMNGSEFVPAAGQVRTSPVPVSGVGKLRFEWKDHYGLAGKEAFEVVVNGFEDSAPSVACADLPQRKVVLVSEQLTFTVTAVDDFGVKRVGVEWQGMDKTNFANPAYGERIIAAGGPEQRRLELTGTFSAAALGIEPQPIEVRMFAEDYYPGRERSYSPPHVLYVLSPGQHAIWLTEQLSRWHRQALDVRDQEKQLYETNKELRELSPEELDNPNTRQRIDNQARAERANGRRLTALVTSGEELVQQAMRNPEFGVGHLESWAAMLQTLKDIASNRMPTVADLLQQAAQAPSTADASAKTKSAPAAGMVRNLPQGGSGQESEKSDESKPVPAIVDIESSQQPLEKKEQEEQQAGKKKPSSPGLTLPTTTLIGKQSKSGACPAGEKVDQAVQQQEDLLAEFEKIADELNKLLANLEGSTLVKRLKAASRLQYRIAGRMGDRVESTFGVEPIATVDDKQLFDELAKQMTGSSQDVSNIMDDMQAYFERRRFMTFKTVLDEMRSLDVIGALRGLADELPKETGVSIAQCEFWSDTLDRWAEDLVEPSAGGT